MIEQILKPFGELTLYQGYAQKISEGLKPYIDFKPDYPPFTMYIFSAANILGSHWFTLIWYGLIALATLGTMIVIKKLKGSPWMFLACVLPLGGLFYDRFDIFPAFFTLMAIWLAKKNRLFGMVFLAVAVMTKIYPIIFLPILLLMYWFNYGFKRSLVSLGIFTITMGALIYANPNCIQTMYSYHGHRGIEIESIKAMPLLFKENSVVEQAHGTYEIRSIK